MKTPSSSAQIQTRAVKKGQKPLLQKTLRNKGEILGGKRTAAALKSKAPPIELYQKEECPFSHAVRAKLGALGLDYIAHSVPDHNDLKHQQLVEVGGRDQVPFLVDHTSGTKLYESQAIIAFLDKEYGKPASPSQLSQWARKLDTSIRGRRDQIEWMARMPAERATRLKSQAKDAIETLSGAWNFLQTTAMEAVRSARAKTGSDRSGNTGSSGGPSG